MTFEEAYEKIPGNGWLTRQEAELLWDAVKESKGDILEVGSYQGRSTVLIAYARNPEHRLHCVDPFDGFDTGMTGTEVYDLLRRNLHERQISNVIIHRCRIEDWKTLPVDAAYLDGDHTYFGTLNQLMVAYRAGARTVCVHDYATDNDGAQIKRAIEDCGYYKLVQLCGTMALCRNLR